MKAIILTFSPVSDEDKQLLVSTDITKIAINQHAEELNPTYRIVSDYGIVGVLLERFPQKIVTLRDYATNERLIYAGHINFKGSTMIATVEYLISEKYDDILIVGDNTVHSEIFKERVNKEMDIVRENNPDIKIFQYTNGNFNLPVKSIQQFIKGE